jgi:hypothetical protein
MRQVILMDRLLQLMAEELHGKILKQKNRINEKIN